MDALRELVRPLVKEGHGTAVALYNLKCLDDGQPELVYKASANDSLPDLEIRTPFLQLDDGTQIDPCDHDWCALIIMLPYWIMITLIRGYSIDLYLLTFVT